MASPIGSVLSFVGVYLALAFVTFLIYSTKWFTVCLSSDFVDVDGVINFLRRPTSCTII